MIVVVLVACSVAFFLGTAFGARTMRAHVARGMQPLDLTRLRRQR